MEHIIRQYSLEAGALEIEYIEECFAEFSGRKKTAADIIRRLHDREHLILLSMSTLPDTDDLLPVAFKVGHELQEFETDPALAELVSQLRGAVVFDDRRIFYSWIGGTRSQWRGQGHYRALTEQQEAWAHIHGFHELVVKTKNKFYQMRGTLDHLHFDIIRFLPEPDDNMESKVYLSKKLGTEVIRSHRTMRAVFEAA